jgi:hypothetical protein
VLTCMAFCDRSHGCPSNQACYVNVTDRQDAGPPLGQVCGPTCSMLRQTCPTAGTGCYLSDKNCAPEEGICLATGGASQGTACTRMGDCRLGHLCIDPAGPPTPMCAKICDREGGSPACEVGTCRELPGHIQTGIGLP